LFHLPIICFLEEYPHQQYDRPLKFERRTVGYGQLADTVWFLSNLTHERL
jgi:hypothetical protein